MNNRNPELKNAIRFKHCPWATFAKTKPLSLILTDQQLDQLEATAKAHGIDPGRLAAELIHDALVGGEQ